MFKPSSVLSALVVALTITPVAINQLATAQEATSTQPQPIKPLGEVEKIAGELAFCEGPAWDPATSTLYFTDIPNAAIHKIEAGKQTLFTGESAHTNGLLVTASGRLLGCQMDGQVVEYDKTTGKVAKVLASEFEGKRFNAPNDLVIDKSGGVYFTDPLFRAPTPLPQEIQAVYYISADGAVSRVTEGIAAPNGIGLSPDGKQLYVCPSKQAEMLVYNVDAPGKLSDGKTFCQVKQPEGKTDTGADGIVLDVDGNVYITTHLGVEIFSPAGEHRGLVTFPEQPANVTLGGTEGKTMYVTARNSVYKVEMPIAGLKPN